MNNPPIRFCGFDFPYNPETIEISKELLYYEMPQNYDKGTVLKSGVMARKITGRGAFVGRDCFDKYNELMSVFINSEIGVLNIYEINPILAKFTKLNLCLQPSPNCIEYEFAFVEDVSSYEVLSDIDKVHIVKEFENLWSIANIYNLTVDELYKLNPQIKIINNIQVGERLVVL